MYDNRSCVAGIVSIVNDVFMGMPKTSGLQDKFWPGQHWLRTKKQRQRVIASGRTHTTMSIFIINEQFNADRQGNIFIMTFEGCDDFKEKSNLIV
jgi:hypothetical protein